MSQLARKIEMRALLVILIVVLVAIVIVVTMYTRIAASTTTVFGGHDSRYDVVYEKWAGRGSDEFRRKLANEATLAARAKIAAPIEEYGQISGSIKYESNTRTPTFAIHVGQRKLFVSELQFLTEHALEEPTLVLYVGSAPGHKNAFLASLFPRAKFLLVDPNKFAIVPCSGVEVRQIHAGGFDEHKPADIMAEALRRPEQIITVQSYFTDEFADAIAGAGVKIPILFISDIRTNSPGSAVKWDVDDGTPDDVDIITNSAQQYLWIQRIQPKWSMLKFRLPFRNGSEPGKRLSAKLEGHVLGDSVRRCKEEFDLDFVGDFARNRFVYFPGTIRVQAWAGVSSTESRLIVGPGVPAEHHNFGNVGEYENKFFWYNKVPRCFAAFRNPNMMQDIGFDYCNDCAIENAAWERYISASGDKRTVRELVRKMTKRYLTPNGGPRSLFLDNHGHFFSVPRTSAEIEKAALLVPRHNK